MSEAYPVDQLQALLDQLEQIISRRDESSEVTYRVVTPDEVVDDSPTGEEPEDLESVTTADITAPDVLDFVPSSPGPVVAVDCGIARLGETRDGLVIALRATVVTDVHSGSSVSLFRSGPIYLVNRYKAQALHQIGRHLGKPDLFVELEHGDPADAAPVRLKAGAADDAHQYGDRFRNWFERIAQRVAVISVENGTILFDGALTLRSRDTPSQYMEELAELASQRGNAIIAISKQSKLEIAGRSVRFWLDDVANRACYRPLTPMMRRLDSARSERVMGNVHAARFSVLGPAFRMDVKAARGQSDDEAIGRYCSSASMRGGYPDVLVRAHAHSYFTYPDIIQLQAEAGARFNLAPQSSVELGGIFAPFGGRFK